MYLVDGDVLVRAVVISCAGHAVAREWLDSRLAGRSRTVGLAWPALLHVVATVTGGLRPAATPQRAWQQVHQWVHAPAAWTPVPGPQHAQIIAELATSTVRAPVAAGAAHDPVHDPANGLGHGTVNGVVRGPVGGRPAEVAAAPCPAVAHMAALAIEHGLTVVSCDPLFVRVMPHRPGRRGVYNPLRLDGRRS